MNRFNSYLSLLFYITFGCLLFSCETNQANESNKISSSGSLSLNFHDNIISTNPFEAKTSSEVLIKELLYDRLFNIDGTSDIFKSYTFDSLQSMYVFNMRTDKRFQNGKTVTTSDVRSVLKYLFQYHFQHPKVRSLYFALTGSSLTNWYRENRNILDSIPKGFEVLNDSVFTISLVNRNYDLLENLKSQEFILFKLEGDKYIGSGNYQLVSLNEDISAQLIRVANDRKKIASINLSFIKNEDVVFSEFLAGSLDLITFNRKKNPTLAKNEQLNKLLSDKYPQFQIAKGNESVSRYAVLYNFEDSIITHQILKSANFDSTRIRIITNFQNNSITKTPDSLLLTIPVVKEQNSDEKEYFTDTQLINFKATNPENINPSEPHIVIMEIDVEYSSTNSEIQEKLEGQTKGITAFIELEEFFTYVIYSNKLKGIEDNQSLSEMIENMYFVAPNVY